MLGEAPIGTQLILKPDEENNDEWAVAVWLRRGKDWHHVGYLAAVVSPSIHAILRLTGRPHMPAVLLETGRFCTLTATIAID